MLSDILINSPIMVGEDGKPIGSGFDFSMDPMAADDPELAMVCYNETFLFNLNLYRQALRVSLEEQRQRQDEETRRVQQESLEQMQTGEGNLVIIEMILTLIYFYILYFVFTVDGDEDKGGFLAQAGTAELPYSEVSSCFY